MKLSLFSVQDHYPDGARTVPQLYKQVIDQAVLGEELGYAAFFSAEHHFHPYGVVPNPTALLCAIAQRTTRIRLGTAISILTFHNPRTAAEIFAMADILSDGRFVLGAGSGYLKHEFEGFDVDPAEKRDRFDECLAIVERLLSGERVTCHAKFSRLDAVKLNVEPIQRPVPLYVAILRKEAAYHVGLQGRGLLTVPYGSLDHVDEIGSLVSEFRRGRTDAGNKAVALPQALGDNVVCLHTHVAETDAAARKEASGPFDLYVETRLYAKKMVYDDILQSGIHLFGSVETVTKKLCALADMGVDHVMTMQNFGNMAPADVTNSMRLLAERVMPQVRQRQASRSLRGVA